MPYFLAIDAGGTKTRCLLADDHTILARASTGSIKLMRVSEPEATLRLTSMLADVSLAAHVPLDQITRTCIGIAGFSIPAVRVWATDTLSTTVSGSLLLLGDEEIALDAAFPAAPGILLIAGTGSNCIARASDGTLHRAGGWGPILGDEGGGYWIGLQAVRAALRALDRLPLSSGDTLDLGNQLDPETVKAEGASHVARGADILLAEIQQHFNLAALSELIQLGNRRGDAAHSAPDFASLVSVIVRSASDGNPISTAILERAGNELANLVTAVARKVLKDSPARRLDPVTASPLWIESTFPVAFTGSILAEIPAVYTALAKRLARTAPRVQLHPVPVDPLAGALCRARNS